MKRLFIIGAGGHGAVAAEAAVISGRWGSVNFLDDNADPNFPVVGCPVVGKTSLWPEVLGEDCEFFVAIGDNVTRDKFLSLIASQGGWLACIIHPSATISPSAIIEPGVVVCAAAVVNPRVTVGRGSIVNTCASIDHDCVLGGATHISPGAHLAGGVCVGPRSWIGIGAVVKEGITIGSDCMIGAGAAVVSNVESGQTVAGVPATVLSAI